MKRIQALIEPFVLDDVVQRLRLMGVGGMTLSEVQGWDGGGGRTTVYRGSSYLVDLVPRLSLEIVAEDNFVEATVNAIRVAADQPQARAGLITITQVDDAVRIRTGETGDDAL